MTFLNRVKILKENPSLYSNSSNKPYPVLFKTSDKGKTLKHIRKNFIKYIGLPYYLILNRKSIDNENTTYSLHISKSVIEEALYRMNSHNSQLIPCIVSFQQHTSGHTVAVVILNNSIMKGIVK